MNKEYIDKHEAYLLLKQKAETYMLPATKEAYEKAARLIDSLPTIEVEPVNGWISVEDRLPEPETWVLVYIEYPKPVFEMERGISKTDAVKKVFFDGKSMYNNYGNITHWQPLPKSPKKLSREESNELLYGNYEEDRKTMIGNNE